MGRRVLGAVVFLAVGALVFAGLGWVTVAGLRVEEAQREAAAQAALSTNLRLALWRLELRMAPILTGEDIRPYDHYAADPTADNTLPSPLLDATLPPWMKLHFQVDPDAGWQSPQVPPADVAEQLRNFVPTPNVTAERQKLLAGCSVDFPARQAESWLFPRDRTPERVPAPPGSTPAPAEPVTGLSANSVPTPDAPKLDAPAPTPPPAENPTPTFGEKTDLSQIESLRMLGVELRRLNRGEPADGLMRQTESFARGVHPPPAKAPPAPRMIPAPSPPAGAELQQLTPPQAQAPNDPAVQLGMVPFGNRGRAGNDLDNLDGENRIRGNILDKAADEARKASPPSYPGRGGFTQNPAGNSPMPNNTVPPGGPAPRGMPRTPGDIALQLKEPPTIGVPLPGGPGGPGGTLGRAGAGGLKGGGVAGTTTGQPGDAAGRAKAKGDTAPPAPKAAAMERGSSPSFGSPLGGGFGARPGSTPTESKDEAKKRAEDLAALGGMAGKSLKDTEALRRYGATEREHLGLKLDDTVTRFGWAAGLRYRLSELGERELREKLADLKPDDEQRRGQSALAKPAAPADPNKDDGTAKREAGAGDTGAGLEKKAEPRPLAEDAPRPEPTPAPIAIPWAAPPPVAVHLGPMRPRWLTAPDGTQTLALVRVAKLGDTKAVYQGVVLDWERLEEVLREEVKDLFPDARLVAVRNPADAAPDRAMTALPVQLDPGPQPPPPPAGWTPLRMGLVLAWAAAVIAFAAVGFSGWSLLDLAERRIRFVSAVTHELRTPLTSLRLYLDMLVSGMVQDEAKRAEYLATLNTESDRLHRLIDNVLDFARLERRRTRAAAHPMKVGDLLETIRHTWADRCGTDGKELVVVSTLPPEQEVCTDPHLVGQIVGNLIDNARKYTRDAADPRIWLWAKPAGRRWVVFEVEDRGPGVPPGERRAIFRPFRRGDAADTRAGGAGLGLALAKQWAEALGGRLTYRPADGGTGACFRLELRVR